MKAKGQAADDGERGDAEVHRLRLTHNVHKDDLLQVVTHEKYRVNDFYCRSLKDGKGEKVSITLPAGTMRLLTAIAADHPDYDSSHDVIRDAITHRVHFLRYDYEMPEEVKELASIIQTRQRINVIETAIDQRRDAVEHTREALESAGKARDWEQFMRVLNEGREICDTMRPPWDEEMSQVLKHAQERYGESLRRYNAEMNRRFRQMGDND